MIPTSKITLLRRPSYPTPLSPLRHTGSPLGASSPKHSRESQDQPSAPAKKHQFTELVKSFQNLAFLQNPKAVEIDGIHSQSSTPIDVLDNDSHLPASTTLDSQIKNGHSMSQMELGNTKTTYRHPPSDHALLKVYIVIQAKSSHLYTAIWNPLCYTIKGVYQNEEDANNKVLLMYQEAIEDFKDLEIVNHQILFWERGENGSPHNGWETGKITLDDCHIRVYVEQWSVTPEGGVYWEGV